MPKTIDEIATVAHMTGSMSVRLQIYTGEPMCAIASPVAPNGHMVNHRAPWIASHVCNQMKIAKPFRFFTTYLINTGERGERCACFEITFNWIGNIALCIQGSRMVTVEEMAGILGEVPTMAGGIADALQY